MRSITLSVLSFLFTLSAFSQKAFTNKIVLTNGQKIIVENNISIEASLSMGMEVTSKTASENTLEVKNITDKTYAISNTTTKLKVDLDMMGQQSAYDSDKKEDRESENGKNFTDMLDHPQDIIIDNTGNNLSEPKKEEKKEGVDGNPADLLSMFAEGSDDASVTGAFELIPAGKHVGDTWIDSTINKDNKVTRQYTLISVTGDEAVIQLDIVMTANNTLTLQGMEMAFASTTKTKTDIITNISTGLVKTRTSKSEITGNIQLMGQEMPVTAKSNSTIVYR